MKPPFPYFGSKRIIAPTIWKALGDVHHYVEPFAGSLAVLLARPAEHLTRQPIETVNDADGLLANFWRALSLDPDAVIRHAENPVNECDLHARHIWLLGQRDAITDNLMGDPHWHDPVAAGWWAWGICSWIGSGWCSGKGPWTSVGGLITKTGRPGVSRQIPHLGTAGAGINAKAPNSATSRQQYWLSRIQDRIRHVRVACGNWERVVASTSTLFPESANTRSTITGVVLDPPYRIGGDLYGASDPALLSRVQEWCVRHGNNPRLRIVLCGYEGEVDLPGWAKLNWEQGRSYAKSAKSSAASHGKLERLWLSPGCLPIEPKGLSSPDDASRLTGIEHLDDGSELPAL